MWMYVKIKSIFTGEKWVSIMTPTMRRKMEFLRRRNIEKEVGWRIINYYDVVLGEIIQLLES